MADHPRRVVLTFSRFGATKEDANFFSLQRIINTYYSWKSGIPNQTVGATVLYKNNEPLGIVKKMLKRTFKDKVKFYITLHSVALGGAGDLKNPE